MCVSVKVLKGHVVFLQHGPVRSYKFLWKCAEMCQQHRKLTQDCLLLVIHHCRCAEQHHQSAALKLWLAFLMGIIFCTANYSWITCSQFVTELQVKPLLCTVQRRFPLRVGPFLLNTVVFIIFFGFSSNCLQRWRVYSQLTWNNMWGKELNWCYLRKRKYRGLILFFHPSVLQMKFDSWSLPGYSQSFYTLILMSTSRFHFVNWVYPRSCQHLYFNTIHSCEQILADNTARSVT